MARDALVLAGGGVAGIAWETGVLLGLTEGRAVPDGESAPLGDARVSAVFADAESMAAPGTDPLDPATRRPAAETGRRVGRAVAADVAALRG